MAGKEQTVFLPSLGDPHEVEGFERLYLGSDVCQYLLPGRKSLENALSFCDKENLKFSLVTPLVNDFGIQIVKNLLEILEPGTEVIINDWGVYPLVIKKQLTPVLGRSLVKMTRNVGLTRDNTSEMDLWDYTHCSNFSLPLSAKLFGNMGIFRIELDNTSHGVDVETPADTRLSLYSPYVVMHLTRKCRILFGNKRYPKPGSMCNRPCRKNVMDAELYGYNVKIGGSAIYFVNDNIPNLEEIAAIDRLVTMKRWPTG